jgi:thiopeptide-type bacteriocin biosynthesis protein
MPLDRLNRSDGNGHSTLDTSARAVLDVLAGASIGDVAACVRIEPTILADAVKVFQQAGCQALVRQAASVDWWQLYIEFADWSAAENAAANHLLPILHRAEADSSVISWWFVRKYPCWRLRLRIQPGLGAKASMGEALDELVAAGRIRRWWPGIYEPETPAFGGGKAMAVAHQLFHADSRAALDLSGLGEAALGRRELSVLLCTVLLRAAGLEWYEQADVWHRVAEERPLPVDVRPEQLGATVKALKTLMLADTEQDGPLLGPDGLVAFAAGWAGAYQQAGRALGAAARAGTLGRGLRHVLSYHVIFHWNRWGLPVRTQSAIAWAARTAILDPPPDTDPAADGQAMT